MIFEGKNPNSRELVQIINREAYEFYQIRGEQVNARPNENSHRWNPSPVESLKINYDASWGQRTKVSRIGIVARNSKGQVVGGLNRQVRMGDAETLEAVTIFKGLQFAIDRRWTRIEIETDAHNVISHITGGGRYYRNLTTCETFLKRPGLEISSPGDPYQERRLNVQTGSPPKQE